MRQLLLQLLTIQHDLLTRLQHEQHPRPLRLARIPPRMERPSLHGNIPPLQHMLLPRIQGHLNLAIQQNSVVQANRAVHNRLIVRRKVHIPTHGAAWVHEAQLARVDQLLVFADVRFVVHVHGELGSCEGHAESHGVIVEGLPGYVLGAVHDGFLSGGVVGGYVAGWLREGGDFAFAVEVGHGGLD